MLMLAAVKENTCSSGPVTLDKYTDLSCVVTKAIELVVFKMSCYVRISEQFLFV